MARRGRAHGAAPRKAAAALLGATLLAVGLQGVAGAVVKGYKGAPPAVPNPVLKDLVVEQVWAFDAGIIDANLGLVHMTWVPGTEQVVVLRKGGLIHLYDSVDAAADDYVELLDMSADVASLDDHGLLGFSFHPDFGVKPGVNTAYVLYSGQPKNVAELPNNAAVAPFRPATWGAGPPGLTGYSWNEDGYLCPALAPPQNNYGGKMCEKVYYIDRLIYNAKTQTMVKDITLYTGACGSSSTHGTGAVQPIPGGLAFAMGDGAQYDAIPVAYLDKDLAAFANIDPGFPMDGCTVPGGGLDQGQFRAQRMDFPNGKIMLLPTALLNSPAPIDFADLHIISRGSRQPYRMFYHDKTDTLYVADVGQGDGPTTERMFVGEAISKRLTPAFAKTPYNWGWPCVEGVYGSVELKYAAPDAYAVYDAQSEQSRSEYLANNGLNICASTYAAVQELTGVAPPFPASMPAGTVADAQWRAPVFEYRDGVMDPEFPNLCLNDGTASITAIHLSTSKALPLELQGKLFFGDHVKGCVWYFDNDATGAPDFTNPPHILMTLTNAVDIQTGPDGALYIIDYDNARVTRAFGYGLLAAAGPTEPPTPAPTPAPFVVPKTIAAEQCFPANGVPELEWTRQADGTYAGALIFDAVNLVTPNGVLRTRAYNYQVSAPVMRMKACNTYVLSLTNNLDAWPLGLDAKKAVENTVHDPTLTGLHVHGLHVSGMGPSDDVFAVVAPGETAEYIYALPCDHNGGSYWYHPHHHGSTALQLGGGAAGLLIVEPGPREASSIPVPYQVMPEQYIVMHDFDIKTLATVADAGNDPIFAFPGGAATQSFAMANGCPDALPVAIEAGQWTKLRLLNVGATYNIMLSLVPGAAAMAPCDLMLLAKDGVPVADAPRVVNANNMFFSLSSRVDVAVRCPAATAKATPYQLTYQRLGAASLEKPPPVALLNVYASDRPAALDLPPLAPCRPTFLADIAGLPVALAGAPFQVAMRGDGINGEKFTEVDENFRPLVLGQYQSWTVSGSYQHPLHMHVNHFQFGVLTAANDMAGLVGWNAAGDWVDTIAVPNGVQVFVRPERYVGPSVLHCHIAQHSDTGVIKVMQIVGPKGVGGPEDNLVADWGTCPADIVASAPFGQAPTAVPGVIVAPNFDLGGEGIAYHNLPIDRNAISAARVGEASVEIDNLGKVPAVTYIRAGEWLTYTVNVADVGYYTASLVVAAAAAGKGDLPPGMHWSLYVDAIGGCPALGSKNQLVAVADDEWNGTGGALEFAVYPVAVPFALPAGPHTLTICFEKDALFSLAGIQIDAAAPAVAQNGGGRA